MKGIAMSSNGYQSHPKLSRLFQGGLVIAAAAALIVGLLMAIIYGFAFGASYVVPGLSLESGILLAAFSMLIVTVVGAAVIPTILLQGFLFQIENLVASDDEDFDDEDEDDDDDEDEEYDDDDDEEDLSLSRMVNGLRASDFPRGQDSEPNLVAIITSRPLRGTEQGLDDDGILDVSVPYPNRRERRASRSKRRK